MPSPNSFGPEPRVGRTFFFYILPLTHYIHVLLQFHTHKRSILDFVLQESKDLQGRITNADKVKLDEYMYAVREVEKELERRDDL